MSQTWWSGTAARCGEIESRNADVSAMPWSTGLLYWTGLAASGLLLGLWRLCRAEKRDRSLLDDLARSEQAAQRASLYGGHEPARISPAKVEAAAMASLRQDARLCLIYIELGVIARAPLLKLLNEIFGALGPVDFVQRLKDGNIAVCVPMLSGAAELAERVESLRGIVEKSIVDGRATPVNMGFAIHPADGYDADTLVASARAMALTRHGRPWERPHLQPAGITRCPKPLAIGNLPVKNRDDALRERTVPTPRYADGLRPDPFRLAKI
jgi:hypothetical protein